MFSVPERDALRNELVSRARTDPRICAAALTGSASLGREDRWSDIDLFFGVAREEDVGPALSDWTEGMYALHGAIAHLDVLAGQAVYRVFLLDSTLQVDLAFAPQAAFRARAESFRVLFGTAQEPESAPKPDARELLGRAWLYALHARTCIRRSQVWRAAFMVGAMRDAVLSAACVRLGLDAANGRGFDALPSDVLRPLEDAMVRRLTQAELARAFAAAVDGLVRETAMADPALCARVKPTLEALARSAWADDAH